MPCLDVEFHIRRIKYLFGSLRIKKNATFDIDVAFHMHRIGVFDSAQVQFVF